MEINAPTIAEQWEAYSSKNFDENTTPALIELVKTAFYAGNYNMFYFVVSVSSCPELKETERQLSVWEHELHAFRDELRDREDQNNGSKLN